LKAFTEILVDQPIVVVGCDC